MAIPPLYILSTLIAAALIALGLKRQPPTPNDFINLNDTPEPAVKKKPEPQIHCIYLSFKQPVLGSDLFQYFMSHQLIFNDQQIFHSILNGDTQFAIATLNAPGTFDLKTMNKDHFKGLTFFMSTTDSHLDLERFDMMCEALLDATERFGGKLRSKDHPELGINDLQNWRERLHETCH